MTYKLINIESNEIEDMSDIPDDLEREGFTFYYKEPLKEGWYSLPRKYEIIVDEDK